MLRGYLPAEMRILKGAAGIISGVVLFGSILSILLGGNWQLGYGDDRLLVGIFLVLIPAGLGIVSPLWYWLGRPVWDWFDRPGDQRLHPLREVRFLPGIAGSVLGIALIIPVTATSRLLVQTLAPFGLAIAIGSPLWFWALRPTGVMSIGGWLPEILRGSSSRATLGRSLLVLGILFALSLAITTFIALPVVDIGESLPGDGVTVTVTDAQTVPEITEIDSERNHGSDSNQLVLVRLSVENRGEVRRQLPGTSVGDITVIAPPCSAQNFGEPSHNCNQVFVDGNFRVDGTAYTNYGSRQASTGGTIEPGARISGWLVFRRESRQTRSPQFESMVIVNDVGRWILTDESG